MRFFDWVNENVSNRTYLVVPPLYSRFMPHYTGVNTTSYYQSREILYSDLKIEEIIARALQYSHLYNNCWFVYSDYVSMPEFAKHTYEAIDNSSHFSQVYNSNGIVIWKMNA